MIITDKEKAVIMRLREAIRKAGKRTAILTVVVNCNNVSIYEGQPKGQLTTKRE